MKASPVWANQFFRRLWIAQGISVFGDYLAMFAVQSAIVFRMRGSPGAVSEMLLASLLPAIAMGPLAGVLADRWNPRAIMVASDGFRAVLVMVLLGARELPQICVICLAISCVSAFFVPAQAVAIPLLVGREHLLLASATLQQTLQLARIASPAAAAAVVSRFGENACYMADAASFLFSAGMLATIPCRPERGGNKFAASCAFREFRDGLRCTFAIPAVSFALLSMVAGTFAAGCYSALAAIYVRDLLRAGASVYGAMGSLTAVGTFAGAVLIPRIARTAERESLIATGMGVIGVCILLLAIFPALLIGTIAAFGIGLGAGIALVAASATLRERTPAKLRGRASSVSMSLMSAAQAAAILLAGSCAGSISGRASGVRAVYVFSGAMLLAQPACRCFRRGTTQ